MRSTPVFVGALMATWLLAPGVTAQVASPTGNIYGTARDTQGNALIGVTVTAAGPGAPQIASTDSKGDFHFLNLSPGTYAVTLQRSGLETAHRDVTVALGNAVLSVSMPVAGVTEAVTVEGGAPALDSRKIQTGATFGREELEGIPTTRDPWAILRQVPGVLLNNVNVGGDKGQGQSFFVGKGSHSDQNSYDLDGVAISLGPISPMFFDFDSLSNIEVATGGSDLALATPGVTLNLVTKRGTNELRASARALFTGNAGWDYGVEAGGPLWKDRLWLWGAFAHNDYLGQSFLNVAGEPLRSQETYEHWNGKLNAALVPANSLTLSYTDFVRTARGWQTGRDRDALSSWNNDHPARSFKVEDSQVLSTWLFGSFYVSYVPAASTYTPVGGLDQQADQDVDGIYRHSFLSRRVLDIKHQSGLNASAFFDTGDLRHELKFGFGYRHIRFDSALNWPGDQVVGHVRFPSYADVSRPQNAKSEVNLYDAFLGDTIQAGNLTINVGARFDYQQGRNLPSAVSANPVFPELLPAVHYGGDAGYSITWRQVQPRIGATYALGGNRTLLRASYSRFVNQLDSTTVFAVNAFPSIADLYYTWNDANGNGRVERGEVDTSEDGFLGQNGLDRFHPGSLTPINRIDRGLKPPTNDEFIVGVERQISSDWSGSLAYTYRILRNFEFFPVIGTTRASYRYLGNATGTATARSNGFVLNFDEPYYGLTECPAPCEGVVVRNRPDARETYGGVELQLLKAFSHGWMARVSFGYNDWRQHIGSGAIIDPNNVTPGINANGPVVDGNTNATWQFNVSGMVQLPLGVAAGVSLFGRQGFAIPYWVDVFTNDAQFVTSIQIGSPTRYRTPDVFVLDLQLSKAFRIGSNVTVSPQFDCFNALNRHTVLQRDGAVGSLDVVDGVFRQYTGFNAPLEFLSSRVLRGGLRVAF